MARLAVDAVDAVDQKAAIDLFDGSTDVVARAHAGDAGVDPLVAQVPR